MRNILRVIQLTIRAIIIMILLIMMQLILRLIISMVSRPIPKIRQLVSTRIEPHELSMCNMSVRVVIHQAKDFLNNLDFVVVRDFVVTLKSVCFEDFVCRPGSTLVKVVEVEEGGGVKVVDVVLL